MKKSKFSGIHYHPEFLFFNDMVRRKSYKPATAPWIWESNRQGKISDYAAFDYFLNFFCYDLKGKAVTKLIEKFHAKGDLPDIDIKFDINPWLEFAYSIGFEKKLSIIKKSMFELFGTTFDLPPILISPPRLHPRNGKVFRQFVSGYYSEIHILKGDPPFFNPYNWLIFMPVPEHVTQIKTGFYEEMLAHELLHVPFRGLGYFSWFEADGSSITNTAKDLWAFDVFGELFANLGSIAVLHHSGAMSKEEINLVWRTIQTQRAVALCPAATIAATIMYNIPFRTLCQVAAPVFEIFKKRTFLAKEKLKITSASEKRLVGYFKKKLAYKNSVSGKGLEVLKKDAKKHLLNQVRALSNQVAALNLGKLLTISSIKEKNTRDKNNLQKLAELFSTEHKDDFAPLLTTIDKFRESS